MLRPTRVTFDNNFLDAFHAAPAAVRARILRCIDVGALELFANYEVLQEVQGIADSGRAAKLIPIAADILDLTRGRFLNLIQPMLETDALGRFELEMDAALREQITAFLRQTADGHIPSAAIPIATKASAMKKAALEELKQYTALVDDVRASAPAPQRRRAAKNVRTQLATLTFEDVRSTWVTKYGLKYLTQLFEGWGLSEPAELATRVLATPARFPHVTTWLSIQSLPAYRYRALGEKKDEGDLFDLWQMLYLVDMDVYVTNEKRLPRWYGDIFGRNRRVMTAEAFLATNWCRCWLCWRMAMPLRNFARWVRERRDYIRALETLDLLTGRSKHGTRIFRRLRRWCAFLGPPE